MKIIKPFRAGLLTRPFQWRGRTKLAVGVYVLVSRDKQGHFLGAEQKIWSDILPMLDSGGVLDQIMPKARPEYLISGSAYTAHQDDKTQCMVKAEVGDLKKALRVTGQRFWIDNTITPAQEFESMPVDWSHAFGGQHFVDNPEGLGLDEHTINGTKAVPLPNIEDPLHGVKSKGDRPAPASFSPLGMTHPQRLSKQGTYSEEWYRYEFPGFLPDMDPSIFNMAAQEQQWPGLEQLPLGASFRVWNMHPALPCWEDTIAPLQARVLVVARDTESRQCIKEVPDMQASTLWLLPESQSYIMMFHGSIDIQDAEADDIEIAMAAIEMADAPKPSAYYEQVLAWRRDPKQVMYHLDKDEELIAPVLMRSLEVTDHLVDKNRLGQRLDMYLKQQHEQTKAWFDQNGLDYQALVPEFIGPPERPVDLADNPERAEKIVSDARLQVIELMQDVDDPEIERYIQELQNPEGIDLKSWKLDRSGPPDLDFVDDMNRSARTFLSDAHSTQKEDRDSEDTKDALRKSYLYTAHLQKAIFPLERQKSQALRAEVIRRYQQKEPLCGQDFTGADLSALDLRSADFSGSFLESASFEGATLTGADFSEAVLTRARFAHAIVKSANFRRANLGEAVLSHTTLQECNFEESELVRISISSSEIVRSKFINIMSDYVQMADSTLLGCDIQTCLSSDFNLKGVTFRDCKIEKWAFMDSQLVEVVFDASNLKDASVTTCKLDNCEFLKSHLDNLLIEDDVDLIKCKFVGSRLKECNFMNITVKGSSFLYSDVSGTDFSKSRLTHCDFDHVIARDAIFHKTDLTGSSFRNANLIQATLEKANLSAVNFEGATLFRTNVSKVHVDGNTRLSGAFMEELEMYPLYRDDEQRIFRLFANE